MSDPLTEALNSPGGHLAEVLLQKMKPSSKGEELSESIRERLDKLIGTRGKLGALARVRCASDISYLFERAPKWTSERMLPLFEWTSAEATALWSARKYSGYIGSPKLFARTKAPFLELFSRKDVPDEDRSVFAEWLATIALANQSKQARYPITFTEMRSALRRVGPTSLSNVAHRLYSEMAKAKPDEKIVQWRKVVGPVFQGIWPLDAELQLPTTTFSLVQILLSCGDALAEAASVIIPFIRPEDPRHHTSVFSIGEADNALYQKFPEIMLDLLGAAAGDASGMAFIGLDKALGKIEAVAPHLTATKKFQRLRSLST